LTYSLSRMKSSVIYRTKKPSVGDDLECFLSMLSERVSDSAKEVLRITRKRFERYIALVAFFEKGLPKKPLMRTADAEAVALKRMIDFELKRNKSSAGV